METYGADFLTPSFVICISKHHHHHQGVPILPFGPLQSGISEVEGLKGIHMYICIHIHIKCSK
jgi:hypothetical protein